MFLSRDCRFDPCVGHSTVLSIRQHYHVVGYLFLPFSSELGIFWYSLRHCSTAALQHWCKFARRPAPVLTAAASWLVDGGRVGQLCSSANDVV
jgi:hypothetical protein